MLCPAKIPHEKPTKTQEAREDNRREPDIILARKNDNPYVSTRNPADERARTEWWKMISLTRPRDAYPHFLANKAEIEKLLRAGHTMYRVWEAYRKATPPFPATYETFRTYCGKHGLSRLREASFSESPGPSQAEASEPVRSSQPAKAPPPTKVWPRLPGKPPEFTPRTEDD